MFLKEFIVINLRAVSKIFGWWTTTQIWHRQKSLHSFSWIDSLLCWQSNHQ